MESRLIIFDCRFLLPGMHFTGALSDAQLEQQEKFAVAGKFAQSMNDLLTLGFKDQAIKMTGKNYGQSLILRNAITGTYPDFQIEVTPALHKK